MPPTPAEPAADDAVRMRYGPHTCSLQMAVTAPDVYRTFLDISGEAEPTLDGHADTPPGDPGPKAAAEL